MMTIAEAEKTFITQLKSVYDDEEAKGMSFLVIHHLTGISKSHFLLNKADIIEELHQPSLLRIINELKTGKPLQYILGETEFYGLRFKVNPSVLIPRPETEELVDWIVNEVRSLKSEIGPHTSHLIPHTSHLIPHTSHLNPQSSDLLPQTPNLIILDIGTGSGCIAVSLKKHLPEARVHALDKFPAVLDTARQNAALNETEIIFFEADILNNPDLPENLKYSIIVSNPPYISNYEKQNMHTNVLEHEPHTALFVSDETPLIFYERIAAFAKTHLINGGLLFFEINEELGKATVDILKKDDFFNIELKKDLQGKDRMIRAQYRI